MYTSIQSIFWSILLYKSHAEYTVEFSSILSCIAYIISISYLLFNIIIYSIIVWSFWINRIWSALYPYLYFYSLFWLMQSHHKMKYHHLLLENNSMKVVLWQSIRVREKGRKLMLKKWCGRNMWYLHFTAWIVSATIKITIVVNCHRTPTIYWLSHDPWQYISVAFATLPYVGTPLNCLVYHHHIALPCLTNCV